MCFAYDALPPDLPPGLVVASAESIAEPEQLSVTSADGTVFMAAFAESPAPRGPMVVILPDVRGLYRFYRELALRFASAGHHAVAIDYFGRTAGTGDRDDEFDFMPHIKQTGPADIQADIAAAIAQVRDRTGTGQAVTVGFCFGGSQSFLAARNTDLDLAGVIGFYGGLDGTRLGVFPSPAEHTSDMHGPILGLFGGDDPSIPPELVEQFDDGLTAAGVDHELVTYPGAPHSFFDRTSHEHQAACDDAWQRVLSFLHDTPPPSVASLPR